MVVGGELRMFVVCTDTYAWKLYGSKGAFFDFYLEVLSIGANVAVFVDTYLQLRKAVMGRACVGLAEDLFFVGVEIQ